MIDSFVMYSIIASVRKTSPAVPIPIPTRGATVHGHARTGN